MKDLRVALEIPLHTNLVLMAQCRHGLRRKAHFQTQYAASAAAKENGTLVAALLYLLNSKRRLSGVNDSFRHLGYDERHWIADPTLLAILYSINAGMTSSRHITGEHADLEFAILPANRFSLRSNCFAATISKISVQKQVRQDGNTPLCNKLQIRSFTSRGEQAKIPVSFTLKHASPTEFILLNGLD